MITVLSLKATRLTFPEERYAEELGDCCAVPTLLGNDAACGDDPSASTCRTTPLDLSA